MSVDYFLDTNILVYTFDTENSQKQSRATELVELGLRSGNTTISFQVVQEFLNVATRKFAVPMSPADAQNYLRVVLDPLCSVWPSIQLYTSAIDLQQRWQYGFYDSLIIASALQAQCDVILTEDLQHGQSIQSLSIVNPFHAE